MDEKQEQTPKKPSFLALRKSHPDHEENKRRMAYWSDSNGDKIWLKGDEPKSLTPTLDPSEEVTAAKFLDDGFEGEIVVQKVEAVDDDDTFEIYSTSPNHSEIPTGQYTGFENFVKEHDLEILVRDGKSATVRAEWGNGEGYDTYDVIFTS